MPDVEISTQPVSAPEQLADQTPEPAKAPPASATGNAHVVIQKHDLVEAVFDPQDSSRRFPAGVDLVVSNDTDMTLATIAFQALFYDNEGNLLETVNQKATDLQPERSRGIRIDSSQYEPGKVSSYVVRVVRTTTADVEKVQLRRFDIRTTETGEEIVHGIVKNLSRVKTDAAVAITFQDANKENIGTKVVLLRDIAPDTIRQYEVTFKPQEGDTVVSYDFRIGEIAA